MNEIILWHNGDCWVAEYRGPEAARIVELFDTAMIPTPYTTMPAEYVLGEIVRLNPDCYVTIGGAL